MSPKKAPLNTGDGDDQSGINRRGQDGDGGAGIVARDPRHHEQRHQYRQHQHQHQHQHPTVIDAAGPHHPHEPHHFPHLEYEEDPDRIDDGISALDDASADDDARRKKLRDGRAAGGSGGEQDERDTKLLLSFLVMIVVGSGNKIFQKLQAMPMYNYPNFLNILLTFMYVPLSFVYIIPVSYLGLFNSTITPEQWVIPKSTFAVMGALDCVAGIMQTFAAVYLPGPLLVLLPQAAIPVSMALSGRLLGERYGKLQYVGAAVVILGICVVLEPLISSRHAPAFVCEAFDEEQYCTLCEGEVTEGGCLSHHLSDDDGDDPNVAFMGLGKGTDGGGGGDGDDLALCQWVPYSPSSSSSGSSSVLVWSVIMILSCIPMTLSSIYKETALGTADLDPIFLNGWVALFQFLFSLVLAVPAGMASSPPVYPSELPRNMLDGLKCYMGVGSIFEGCHPDDMCAGSAPLLVNSYLVLNVCYNILIVRILKFGSSNLLYLAMTVMIPIGNLAFALPFLPGGGTQLHLSDAMGLTVIMAGLVTYRFGADLAPWLGRKVKANDGNRAEADMLTEALLDPNDPNVI